MRQRLRYRNDLTIDRVRELLDYDPATGVFRWRVSVSHRTLAGSVAGHINRRGYVVIEIDGKKYYGHRLAYLWMTGKWPPHDIDHRSNIPSDNRWENLRPATTSQNTANARCWSNNASGLKGVSFHKSRGRFRATIAKDGQYIHLGYFDTAAAAHAAYVSAAFELFGEFARAG